MTKITVYIFCQNIVFYIFKKTQITANRQSDRFEMLNSCTSMKVSRAKVNDYIVLKTHKS